MINMLINIIVTFEVSDSVTLRGMVMWGDGRGAGTELIIIKLHSLPDYVLTSGEVETNSTGVQDTDCWCWWDK